jgi:hypothetical protein
VTDATDIPDRQLNVGVREDTRTRIHRFSLRIARPNGLQGTILLLFSELTVKLQYKLIQKVPTIVPVSRENYSSSQGDESRPVEGALQFILVLDIK